MISTSCIKFSCTCSKIIGKMNESMHIQVNIPINEIKMEIFNTTQNINENIEAITSKSDEYLSENLNTMKKELDLNNIGEFFFESDHLALKTNSDYQNTLQAMAVLEAQRIQVLKDLDQLRIIKNEALANPIAFVQSLQNKEDLHLPKPMRVANLPNINWSKYTPNCGKLDFATRPNRFSNTSNFTPGFGPAEELENADCNNKDGTPMVRGRVFDRNKPATFNQLWTSEEQKHLEELLIIHPPEEVEAKRWAKIAAELGNRTPTQVASRVQKFFIKLSRAGIPIPGRLPSGKSKTSPKPLGVRKRMIHILNNKTLLQSSTFFRHKYPTFFNLGDASDGEVLSHQVPSTCIKNIQENDDGSRGGTSSYSPSTPASISGDKEKSDDIEEINESEDDDEEEEYPEDPEIREYLYLKRLKDSKLQSQGLAQHVGFKCDRCNCSPIIGTRWHCVECPKNHSTDFCNDCVDCQHEVFPHLSSHDMHPIKQAECSKPFLDRDYVHFMGGDYNYLDPNYMPAS